MPSPDESFVEGMAASFWRAFNESFVELLSVTLMPMEKVNSATMGWNKFVSLEVARIVARLLSIV